MNENSKKLIKEIKKLTKNMDAVFKILDESLSHPAKNFTITYEGRTIDLFHPTTREDAIQLEFGRHAFIVYLLRNAFDVVLCMKVQNMDLTSLEPWEDILGIIGGEDPSDHQFEKYVDTSVAASDLDKSSNELDNNSKSIPLDMNNYQVKENLGLLDEQINQQI